MNIEGATGAGNGVPSDSSGAHRTVRFGGGGTSAGRAAIAAPDTPAPEIPEAPSVPDAVASRRAALTRGGARLRIDPATDQIVVQILNVKNEVIKQVPPEERLRIAARFRQVVGVMFDRQI